MLCLVHRLNFPILDESIADLRAQLAKSKAEAAKKGAPILHDLTPSVFIHQGLELEEQT